MHSISVDGNFITHMKYGQMYSLHTCTYLCKQHVHKDQSQQCFTLKIKQKFSDIENITDTLIN